MLLLALDLAGVFVFGLSGALLGVRKGLDAFGVAVLAIAAALGGGMVRDVLLGAGPPIALADSRYLLTALAAAAAARVGAGVAGRVAPRLPLRGIGGTVRVFDAAGLGLFAVAGTERALGAGLPAVASVTLGVITAVGGGVIRDVLVREIPLVLRAEIYAVAALVGAVIVVAADALDSYGPPVAAAAAAVTFALRMVALRLGWNAERRDEGDDG